MRLIQPAAQGDYDGLCALYCVINAVRLVLAPHRELAPEEVKALFAAGISLLVRRGSLPTAVPSCVPERDWPTLAASVVRAAQAMSDRPLRTERPGLPGKETASKSLLTLNSLVASGKAPCVFLRGKTRHYTVISGYTPASLRLFDSFGYRRVLRSCCGTRKDDTRLHRLHLRSIVTVSVG